METHHNINIKALLLYRKDFDISWITNVSGEAIQHLQPACRRGRYLPFGEDFIYQRTTSWGVPYTFSGKVKDKETGYSYFGARYYSPELLVWLSRKLSGVDPLADTPITIGASMSPYMYVGGHPTMVTDPTGMDWYKDKDGNYVHDKNLNNENKGNKLGEGEKYIGKTYKINVNKGKKNEYNYTLNEDGSFTDSRGKEYEAGSGEFDPGFKSGHKIDNTNSVFTADDLYEYAMNALPVAASVDITVGSDAGGGSDIVPIGGVAIFQGDDAWNSYSYSALDMGGGIALGVEGSVYSTIYWYLGDIANFNKETFKGWSNNVDITVGDGLVVGVQLNWVTDKYGGVLIGIGPHIGGGLGSPVNATYQKKLTYIHE